MKILKKAARIQPPIDPNWWVGREVACLNCFAVVKLELGDPVTITHQRMINGISSLAFRCPECHQLVTEKQSY